jgi:hypothetical protein
MFKLGRIAPPYKVWREEQKQDEESGYSYFTGNYELVDDPEKDVWEAWIDHVAPIQGMSEWTCMMQVRGDTEEMMMFLANEIINHLNDPKLNMKRVLKVGE